jgi:hypothetical protein
LSQGEITDLAVTDETEAMAETLVHAPERIPALVTDARPGAGHVSGLA